MNGEAKMKDASGIVSEGGVGKESERLLKQNEAESGTLLDSQETSDNG